MSAAALQQQPLAKELADLGLRHARMRRGRCNSWIIRMAQALVGEHNVRVIRGDVGSRYEGGAIFLAAGSPDIAYTCAHEVGHHIIRSIARLDIESVAPRGLNVHVYEERLCNRIASTLLGREPWEGAA